jgi:hypothetical protein
MYRSFQASVTTRKGKKKGGCNFDHGLNDFGMRKKKGKKRKRKKPCKTQLRKKERTNFWVPAVLAKLPGWLV